MEKPEQAIEVLNSVTKYKSPRLDKFQKELEAEFKAKVKELGYVYDSKGESVHCERSGIMENNDYIKQIEINGIKVEVDLPHLQDHQHI